MKILHINSYYYMGKFYENLYKEQKLADFDIDVYVPVNKKYKDVKKNNYGDYVELSYIFNDFDRMLFHLKHRKIFEDIKIKYDIKNYDLLHAHSLFSNGYIAYKLNKLYGIPYVVAVRNTDVNVFFKYFIHLRDLGRKIINNAKGVIFISPSYKELVLDKYINSNDTENVTKKTHVIPNGIDQFWLNNIYLESKKPKKGQLRIISAGDINDNKNQLKTVEMCKALINLGYDISFYIAGKIVDSKIYDELIKNDFVKYLGVLNKEQLMKAYRENDIFVMPSKTETFGLVYAEAMTQGLPVIYTRNQGFYGQFEEGEVGYSVDCADKNDLVTQLIKIMDNYEEISIRCKTKSKRFDWSIIAESYNSLYREIIKGNID